MGVRTPRCQTIQRVSCWIIFADNFVIVEASIIGLFEISMISIFFPLIFSQNLMFWVWCFRFFSFPSIQILGRETIRLKIRSEMCITSVLFQCIYLEKDRRNTRVSVWGLLVSSYRQLRSASTLYFRLERINPLEKFYRNIHRPVVHISIISNLPNSLF